MEEPAACLLQRLLSVLIWKRMTSPGVLPTSHGLENYPMTRFPTPAPHSHVREPVRLFIARYFAVLIGTKIP